MEELFLLSAETSAKIDGSSVAAKKTKAIRKINTIARTPVSIVKILGPHVLLTNLRLLLRGEIIDDVELLADLLRRPAFDHRRHLSAPEVEQRPDVQVVPRSGRTRRRLCAITCCSIVAMTEKTNENNIYLDSNVLGGCLIHDIWDPSENHALQEVQTAFLEARDRM